MEFWAAHGVECLLALLCVAIIGMAIWIWRAIRQLKNAQGQMIEQIGAMRAAVEEEQSRQGKALQEAYDATNRMVAELVRAQQARLDAFSNQLTEGQQTAEAETLTAMVDEIRRMEEALAQAVEHMEGLQAPVAAEPPFTRAELESHFWALTEEMRQSERARDAREPAGLTREEAEKLFGALREDMRHMEEAPVESVEMREDLQAYFSALSDEIRKLSAQMGTQAAQSDDAGMMHLYEQARCECKDFSEAIARTQKRLKQANESMEEAARYSRRLQKRARRTEEQGE